MRTRIFVILLAALFLAADSSAQERPASSHEQAKGAAGPSLTAAKTTGDRTPCTDGRAGGFACNNVDLLSFMPVRDLGGDVTTRMNDIWGWTDPETGREYALVGRTDGTAFVDVTDPENPIYTANLPSVQGAVSGWRDIKTIGNYALVVMDYPSGGVPHGIQVFDLTRLRDVSAPPQRVEADALYSEFIRAHNIVPDEESGFAYAVGTETCGGGLHAVDFRNPLDPEFAGCFGESGYTHDAQCLTYEGPDEEYEGREICIGSNADHILIADVSQKDQISVISKAAYPSVRYTHQAWLTPDRRYLLIDDELDELTDSNVSTTRTLIFDVAELDDPQLVTEYFSGVASTDHNQYVHGDRTYQANYTSGLRIVDISDIEEPVEIGYFDTYPANDDPGFDGAWSNYPFFESGIVIVSSIGEGLFVLQPTGPAATGEEEIEVPTAFQLLPAYPNPFNPATTIRLQVDQPQHVRLAVYDVQGREIAVLQDGFVEAADVHEFTFEAGDFASGVYIVRADGDLATRSLTVTLQK